MANAAPASCLLRQDVKLLHRAHQCHQDDVGIIAHNDMAAMRSGIQPLHDFGLPFSLHASQLLLHVPLNPWKHM